MSEVKCRRCDGCANSTHHWIDNIPDEDDWDTTQPQFACKHCPALGDECFDCGGDGEDPAAKDGMCHRCDGEGVIQNGTAV